MGTELTALSLATLKDFDDGLIARLFETELKRLVQDCRDRPADKSKRSLTLAFHITPFDPVGGDIDGVNIEIDCNGKVPKKHTRQYQLNVHANDQLSFNVNNADNPNQMTLDDIARENDEPTDEG